MVPQLPVPSGLQGLLLKNAANMEPLKGEAAMTLYNKRRQWYVDIESNTFMMDLPGGNKQIMSCDPLFLKGVLGTQSKAFTNGDIFRQVFGFFFPESIIVTEGEKWRRIRRCSQKSFDRQSAAKIIQNAAMSSERARDHTIKEAAHFGAYVDVLDVASKITFDAFHMFAYGWDPKTVTGNAKSMELLNACVSIATSLAQRSVMPLPFLWKAPTPGNLELYNAKKTLMRCVDELIEERKLVMAQHDGEPQALLDNLLKSAEEDEGEAGADGKKGLTPSELRDNICTFFFGAYDTTANTTTFMFDYLGNNQRVQDKLREEVAHLDVYKCTPEELEACEYLQCVMKETNRLRATAWAFARTAKEDVEVNGMFVPKGCTIILDHNAMSFQPEHWGGMTDLEEFRPERFQEFKPKPLTGMPFGFGGRVCLGKRIAELEMQTIVVDFLQNYRWESNPREPIQMQMGIGLTAKYGAKCKFERLGVDWASLVKPPVAGVDWAKHSVTG
jgi:cytochrome P450